MTIRWHEARPGANPADLEALERSLGRGLPADYRAFLLEHDGGDPEDRAFDDNVGVTEFLGAAEAGETLEEMGDRMPPGMLPVADAEGGNFVLLAVESGAVLFWDHELEDDLDEAVTEIAPSFAAFLDQLEPFDASDVQLAPGQVKSVWISPDLLDDEGPSRPS